MKKKIIILLTAILVIAAIGIGFWVISSNNKEESISNNNLNPNNDNQNASAKKIAVIYFSATGTTRKVAGYIKKAANSDLIEIIPKEKYTDSDLNYGNDNSRANKEQNDSTARPAISNNINTDSYDIIYLGYPIWWGDVPKIILTFLDDHNLNGKTIIPFCTSGSTGIESSLSTLKNYDKNVNWLDGKRFSASVTQDEITNWVKEISY